MGIEREFFRVVFLRSDDSPRNYEPLDTEELDESTIVQELTELDVAELQAESRAFKKSQRRFALGVVALVGTVVNVLNPPEDAGEFATNFLPVAFVQAVSYLSFKNGIHLMRDRRVRDSDPSTE